MKQFARIAVVAASIAVIPLAGYAQVGKPLTIVDANLVTEADLAKLPHMKRGAGEGRVVAKRPFKTIKDLDAALSSLTKEQRTELYGKLFVPINLNTATDEEILLIPGIGNRMLHEFKEYRRTRRSRSSIVNSGNTSTTRNWRGSNSRIRSGRK
jgi:DNA uptake protein ComE-like DNA-binding protein